MPESSVSPKRRKLEIIYDGECPVCSNLALKTRLENGFELVLVDARQHPEVVSAMSTQGINLNETMVVRTPTDTLSGAAALTYLEAVSNSWGGLSILRPLFRHPRLAVRAYPMLVKMRKALLFVLGRSQIDV